MQSRNKSKFIIILMMGLLMLLLICLITLMIVIKFGNGTPKISENISIETNNTQKSDKFKTVQEVVEYHGSKFISRDKGVIIKTYINSKYDLFDENGKSKELYFRDMISDIVEIEKNSFYLIDSEKKIEIYVEYDKEKDKFTMKINNQEDFYENVDGDIYVDLENTEIVKESDLTVTNNVLKTLTDDNMYYMNTMLLDENRQQLENGYYSYDDGKVLAKLNAGKALNIIFNGEYEDEIATGIHVGTKLKDIEEKYSNLAWGSAREGYLAYRVDHLYVFFYEDQVSVYHSQYKEMEDFDEYLSDYCSTGDLEKLANDFKIHWTNYFEYEYNPEEESLYISYPSRGLEIDIKRNDSTGIKIYNNYYLTDTVKELIKAHKITLESNKNLVLMTEQNRRERMK